MAKVPIVWLRCSCKLLVRSKDKIIAPLDHPTASANRRCGGKGFKIVTSPSDRDIFLARKELERRTKKSKLLKIPTKRAYKQGPGTNPWASVRSATARPSRGSAGAPTLGKR